MAKKTKEPLMVRFGQRRTLVGLLLLIPCLFFATLIISWSQSAFLVPLDARAFNFSFDVLHGHRFVVPTLGLVPFLATYTLIPTFLLVLIFFLLTLQMPGSKSTRILFSFVLSTLFYKSALPGTHPEFIFHLFLSLALVLPLVMTMRGIRLWMYVTLMVFVAILHSQIEWAILWLVVSLVSGESLNFLFISKGKVHRNVKKQPIRSTSLVIGTILLAFWAAMTLLSDGLSQTSLQHSPYWWLAIVCSAFCILLTWLEPWQVHRWIVMATFSQGIFFSHILLLPTLVILAWILIEMGRWFFTEHKTGRRLAPPLAVRLAIFLFVGIGLMAYIFYKAPRTGTFDRQWVDSARKLNTKNSSGVLVVGEGLPFMAHTINGPVISDAQALVSTSEEELVEYLDEHKVSDIVIERNAFNEFWKQWIKEGKDPKTSNQSIISRLINFNGDAVTTSTLKLPALKLLKVEPFEKSKNLVWIRKAQAE